tara:strand:+ start:269 stop:1639 length:1371 start_codon:yes stop_codon:yes gene_type:complete
MFLDYLKEIVGSNGLITNRHELEPLLLDWRGAVQGDALAAVYPRCTSEVSRILKLCEKSKISVVPQGGNTGLCAAATPDKSGEQIILSLTKMSSVRHIDTSNFSILVEAGCILENIQKAASKVGLYFPLSLGAEGSCQIGGNLATNAGGVNVLRYGTARAQVLGLEAVLANGSVVSNLRAVKKDTAGYDLKQLFIGSEGTLGIITAATLRLYPDPGILTTAFVSLDEADDAVKLLSNLRNTLGERIEAFELISRDTLNLVNKHISDIKIPFIEKSNWYVLMDISLDNNSSCLEDTLMTELENNIISNAVVAKNKLESDRLWRMRHSIAEAERAEGKSLKHDISIPSSRIQEFLNAGDKLLANIEPGSSLIIFGHVGDENIHYNVTVPKGSENSEKITTGIYDIVYKLGGSFSAEHGIGQIKKDYLAKYRSAEEVNLMKTLKLALDPNNILNPGKVI